MFSITELFIAYYLSPIYNPIMFDLILSNYTLPDYRYVFTVYVYDGAYTEVSKVKLYPRLDGSVQFDAAPILRNYMTNNLQTNLTGSTGSGYNDIMLYSVRLGYEYSVGDTLVETTYKQYFKFAYNGVYQYENFPYFSTDIANYMSGSTLFNFLSTENTEKTIELDDYETISLFRNSFDLDASTNSQDIGGIRIKVYTSGGGIRTYLLDSQAGSTVENFVQIFGVGPYNLNNTDSGAFSSYSGAPVIRSTDTKYEVYAVTSGNLQVSKTYTYNINTNSQCLLKDKKYRLVFQTKQGGFAYYTAKMNSYEDNSTNKKTFGKYLNYDYSVKDRGRTIYSMNSRKSITVNTVWLTEDGYNELYQIYNSPEVYLMSYDTTQSKYLFIPVNVVDGTYRKRTITNDSLLQMELTLEMANKNYLQI